MTTVKSRTQVAYRTLETQLVDPEYGLVQTLKTRFPHPGEAPIFTAEARLSYDAHDFDMRRFFVGGGGAALDKSQVKISALCESVERYCLYADKADVIIDSYANLSQHFSVLSPSDCPLFHPDQYPAVDYAPFTPDIKIAWSWATTLPLGDPVLVPTRFVYLTYPAKAEEGHLMWTISTGAACGRSATDATVRGIYEIVERDAMMIMWLNRHPCPRLVVDPQSDLGQFIQRYLRSPNLAHHLFWTTNDLEIPACMAILMEGQPGEQRIFVGLSANLNPERAAMNALLEAFEVYRALSGHQEGEPIIEAAKDITSIHKHAIYYIQQDRTHLLDFLLNTPNTVALASIPDKSTGEPEEDLQTCLEQCARAGLSVFAADLTREDIRATGLRVVRVIIPEAQRLTTNHNKPFLGNPRLFTVPVRLGWRDEPLPRNEVNRDPHPFV